MPYARTAAGYPQELQTIADRCADGEVLRIVCETEKAARGLRARWYQYIAACKRDATNPPAGVDKLTAVERVKRVMATEVQLEGATLTWSSRDALRSIPALRGIVSVEATGVVGSAGADASLERLMGKLKGDRNE